MAHVISFKSARFDPSAEKRNTINPIAGQGVLLWLREALARENYRSTEPDIEDWGWYMDVEGGGASYLVGASGDANDPGPEREWVVQVHRHRSLRDRMLGRNRMSADDPLFAQVERIIRGERSIDHVSVDREA